MIRFLSILLHRKNIFFCVLVLLLGTYTYPAFALSEKFPRIAFYYLKAGTALTAKDFPTLVRADIVILPMEAQSYNKDFFAYARAKNPSLIILAYVPSRSINIRDLDDGAQIRKRLKDGIREEWYLKTHAGNPVPAWPGTLALNLTTPWNTYLPNFINKIILSSGVWDGIFYDEIDDSILHLHNGDVDLDENGVHEERQVADEQWQEGVRTLLQKSHELFKDRIIVTNGSSLPLYTDVSNGRMFENFSTHAVTEDTWRTFLESYHRVGSVGKTPRIVIVNNNTRNSGTENEYHLMRYGLASTLLSDGYYSFDFGDQNHGQLWYYDEYAVRLGKPTSAARIQGKTAHRDFARGRVIINPSSEVATIEFDEDFEKIHGVQDSIHNDGSIVSSLDLAAHDGIVLLRPLDRLENVVHTNGSFVRILKPDGLPKRAGFFAYHESVRGGVTTIVGDYNGDGVQDTLSADHEGITIRSENTEEETRILPFGSGWKRGVRFILADVSEDGVLDIIAFPTKHDQSKKKKEPSKITILDGAIKKRILSFEPFGKKYIGSLDVAFLKNSAQGEGKLVVSKGAESPPEVRIFELDERMQSKAFFPYHQSFRGGVAVAAGDIDGDGIDEIVTAPGKGGAPHIRIFDEHGVLRSPGFLAYRKENTSGINVKISDIDGDGKAEILAMTRTVFTTTGFKK